MIDPPTWGSATIRPKSTVFRSGKAAKGNRLQMRKAFRQALSVDCMLTKTTATATVAEIRNTKN